MTGLFEQNLAYFKQELRDLKTSHPIAVGSLDFYQKTATVDMSAIFIYGLYIRLTIKPGELTYPYAQVFVGDTNEGSLLSLGGYQSIENDGTIIQYYINVPEGIYNVIATCTSDFDLIAKKYEEGDWIGEEPV